MATGQRARAPPGGWVFGMGCRGGMVRFMDMGSRHWIKHGVAKGLPVTLEIDVLPADRTVAAVSSRCRLGPVGWLVAAIFGIAVHAFNRMRVSQRQKGRERRRLLRLIQDSHLLAP